VKQFWLGFAAAALLAALLYFLCPMERYTLVGGSQNAFEIDCKSGKAWSLSPLGKAPLD